MLDDPRQRRLFRTSDLTELFHLNEPLNGDASESDKLFRESKLNPLQPNFTPDRIEAMKQLASALSKKIGETAAQEKANQNETDKTDKTLINKAVLENDEKCFTKRSTEADFPIVTDDKSNEKEKTNVTEENKMDKVNEDLEEGEIACKDDFNNGTEIAPKDKKKKKKKKTEKQVSALFDGEKVSCLIGRRLGDTQQDVPLQTADDQYVLSKLFSKAGD